jgi:subtilisin family serine protease
MSMTTAQAQTASSAGTGESSWHPLTPASALARQLSHGVTDRVIVVLKNQLAGLPDTPADSARRSSAVASLQRSVLADLAATHAANVKSISLVNAVAATVSAGEARHLAADPAVARVVPDRTIPVAAQSPITDAVKALKARIGSKSKPLVPLPGACPSKKGAVQLDPEAVEAIHAATQSGKGSSAQALGYTGAGVKVAWIADGLDISNPDFIRPDGQHVFVDYEDFSGTGRNAPTGGGEAFLDASSIAAQGREVYNVQKYGEHLSEPCLIRILGVAPGASLVGLNVIGSNDTVFNSVFLEAINYGVSVDHVNVINESFGLNPFPDTASLDLVKQANDAAVKAGVTVTVASGDSGPTNTLGSPATDPNIISAGASTTYRSYAQTGLGGITAHGVKGWIDDNISGLSSGGFDQSGRTLDVVAPGDLNWTVCTANGNLYGDCTDFAGNPANFQLEGGTSEAAPLTAGVAALVIQAYAESHHGQHPSPAVVKKIIVSTAQNIGAPAEQQGAGMIDAYAAVLAARSYAGTTEAKAGHAVLESATQLNAVGATSAAEHFADTLTNDGVGPVTVHLTSHTLSKYTAVSAENLELTTKKAFSTEIKFHVAPGQARLNVSLASALSAVAENNLSLIAPDGDLAEYNLPQGIGDYGNAQVANPAAGTWTALIQSLPFNDVSTFKAEFEAATATWQPFGHLSTTSVTLAPGASASVGLTVSTPAQPGDESGAIVLRTSAETTTIPVTLRSLAPAPAPVTTFTGVLTGGNGRSLSTGQTSYYEFNVPSGMPMLNATVTTKNADNSAFAELVDPSGVAQASSNNGLLATDASGDPLLLPEKGVNLHVMKPAAGRWTLIIDWYLSVAGDAVNSPFTVNLNVNPAQVAASGLPDSASDHLAAGHTVTVNVQVTNPTSVPEEYFVDARRSGEVSLSLPDQIGPFAFDVPDYGGFAPAYLVPSLTTRLSASVATAKPNYFDLAWGFGDPDLESTAGKTSTLTYAPGANEIPAGDWSLSPSLAGVSGKKADKEENVKATLIARTPPIDPTIDAPTGDLWKASTNINYAFTPFLVLPGGTTTIPVTITPKGAAGTHVTGVLYLSDVSFNLGFLSQTQQLIDALPSASNVAAFPYSYTIG